MIRDIIKLSALAITLNIATLCLAPCLANSTFDFYKKNKPGYELTNFYLSMILETGKTPSGKNFKNVYKTSEAYFQAKKFNSKGTRHIMLKIINAKTPREAFNIAQANANSTRPGWHDKGGKPGVKHAAMKDALRLKFTQNPLLGCFLMATDGLKLREDSPVDDTWGIGKNGKGQNLLGKYLEELRVDLLSGKVKLDWSHTKGAQATQASLDFLKENNRLEYFQHLKDKNVISYSDFLKIKPLHKLTSPIVSVKINANYMPFTFDYSITLEQKQTKPKASINDNSNYAPVKVKGFGTTLSKSIHSLFVGLQKSPPVKISPKKNMLISFANPIEAKEVLKHLQTMGLKGIYIDSNESKNIFISRNQISSFLSTALKLDHKWIKAYFKKNKI